MFLLIGVAMLALGAFLVWRGLGAVAKMKVITDTQTSPVAHLRPGVVEVKGRVRSDREPVISPLTKQSCVYCHFEVEEWKRRGKSGAWVTVISDKKHGGCVLTDGSGDVRIDLDHCELLLKPDTHAKSGTFNDASSQMEAVLAEYGRTAQGFIFNKGMRYTETIIHSGDELYALGHAKSHAAGGYEITQEGANLFVVSDQSEDEVLSHYSGAKWKLFIFGGLALAAGVGMAVVHINQQYAAF